MIEKQKIQSRAIGDEGKQKHPGLIGIPCVAFLAILNTKLYKVAFAGHIFTRTFTLTPPPAATTGAFFIQLARRMCVTAAIRTRWHSIYEGQAAKARAVGIA
jgi:hypothetical protein